MIHMPGIYNTYVKLKNKLYNIYYKCMWYSIKHPKTISYICFISLITVFLIYTNS